MQKNTQWIGVDASREEHSQVYMATTAIRLGLAPAMRTRGSAVTMAGALHQVHPLSKLCAKAEKASVLQPSMALELRTATFRVFFASV